MEKNQTYIFRGQDSYMIGTDDIYVLANSYKYKEQKDRDREKKGKPAPRITIISELEEQKRFFTSHRQRYFPRLPKFHPHLLYP